MKLIRMVVLAGLIAPVMPAHAGEDEAFGFALSLVQKFVRLAAQSDDPQASLKGIDEVLAGNDADANRAIAGLLHEATADMSVEHRTQIAAIGRDLAAAARKGIGKTPVDAASVDRSLQARKDLNAMGLRYYDPKQYLDAVKRDDALAVELYALGAGVNLSSRDSDGRSAVEIARANGNTRIAELLARSLPAAR
jgi:ankyrin repeat protein